MDIRLCDNCNFDKYLNLVKRQKVGLEFQTFSNPFLKNVKKEQKTSNFKSFTIWLLCKREKIYFSITKPFDKLFFSKGYNAWCRWRESDSRPLPYQGNALPLSHSGNLSQYFYLKLNQMSSGIYLRKLFFHFWCWFALFNRIAKFT